MASKRPKTQEAEQELKLAFPGRTSNKHVVEHIPRNYNRLQKWLRNKWLRFVGSSLGRNIYYWQTRHFFQPKQRKIYDIHFLLHVHKDHDSKPTQLIERWHYWKAKGIYGDELAWVSHWTSRWDDDESTNIYLQPHHYARAYRERWIENFDESSQWRQLYHGVDSSVILELLSQADKRLTEREKYIDALLKEMQN